jgi:hypothetical protein
VVTDSGDISALGSASAGIASIDVPETIALDFFCRLVCRAAEADFATIRVALPGDVAVLAGGYGLRDRSSVPEAGSPVRWYVDLSVGEKPPVPVPAEGGDAARSAEGETGGVAPTALIVPLTARQETRSLLEVGWRTPIAPEDARLASLQAQARDLAPLLSGEGTRARLSQLACMLTVSTQEVELDVMLGAMLERAAAALHTKHGVVLLRGSRDDRLLPIASCGLPPAFFRGLAGLRTGVRGEAGSGGLLGHRIEITADMLAEAARTPLHGLAVPLGLRAAWSAPFCSAGGSAIGVLTLYHKVPGEPAPVQRAILGLAARIAGHLYDQSRSGTTAASWEPA